MDFCSNHLRQYTGQAEVEHVKEGFNQQSFVKILCAVAEQLPKTQKAWMRLKCNAKKRDNTSTGKAKSLGQLQGSLKDRMWVTYHDMNAYIIMQ